MDELVNQILAKYQQRFFVVALSGSVAVGKSSFAEQLAEKLSNRGLDCQVVSSDHFLYTNQELTTAGIFEQKGFPASYHLDHLVGMLKAFESGEAQVEIPLYEQDFGDIVPDQRQIITRPNILIVEGVVALQLPSNQRDFSIYLDADLDHIKNWYLSRNIMATLSATDNPKSWRYQYRNMPLEQFKNLALAVWETTNQKNLDDYIGPSRQQADVLVHLDRWHQPDRLINQ
ncbi:type I pantothenate kinase [Convivina intestini]|uniref:Type I pantothenate kinase n=1 Tax=Convivina intestini TaxID=1505726 RepID=A0A2U1D8D4_9LACO|nr:type I pantothenate kinase [Convivina intestini]PVY83782.1 type I pantothenate kinase [Convivina intestini]CAH1854787.1 Pantothenate kinase [Convivina intestini]SDB93113.1 type I pantothenate kinase [Leuconostocaceae bacterium R-53105]